MLTTRPLVTWPTTAPTGSEDGMAVTAYWPRGFCGHQNVTAQMGEVLVSSNEPADLAAIYPNYSISGPVARDRATIEHQITSVDLGAVLPLAVTADVWFDEVAGNYWHATRADLTPEGAQLLRTLDELYGQPAVLLTTLST